MNTLIPRIAVVIPCFKVSRHVLGVIKGIGPEVNRIYVVDDLCPEGSGDLVQRECVDSRVIILRHKNNQGVGGAVLTGYRMAIKEDMEIIVKIDGDGQMDPVLIPAFVFPLIKGEADYSKGNRFFDLYAAKSMPKSRLLGNIALSIMAKLSSGYWNIFDPTNGYTAINVDVAKHLPFDKLSTRYFFETDILFRLNTLRAVVVDIPMEAKYGDELSNLKPSKIIGEFMLKHFRNFAKRLFYNYYLRDVSLASFELPIGFVLLMFGLIFGAYHWLNSSTAGIATPTGTVMLATLSVIMGMQFLLAFVGHDVAAVPGRPISRSLRIRLQRRVL